MDCLDPRGPEIILMASDKLGPTRKICGAATRIVSLEEPTESESDKHGYDLKIRGTASICRTNTSSHRAACPYYPVPEKYELWKANQEKRVPGHCGQLEWTKFHKFALIAGLPSPGTQSLLSP